MENYRSTDGDKDPRLWEIARRRANFKSGLLTYFIVIPFLWVIWFLTSGRNGSHGWPWPIWPTLGWGLGMLFQYFRAYMHTEANSAEREYEKLTNKRNYKS